MASSGRFVGPRGGNSTSPWLELAWSVVDKDITNNRSRVRLTLYLHSSHTISFSSSKTGVLYGSSFTYTGGFIGTGSRAVRQTDIWVNHNSAGDAGVTLSGSFNLAITWGGNRIGNLTVSGLATLDPIPRSSELTSISLDIQSFIRDTGRTVHYNINKKHSSFTHELTLKHAGRTLATWTTSSSGDLSYGLSGATINGILEDLPSAVHSRLFLTLQTKSGTTLIGAPVTISIYFEVSFYEQPVAKSLTTSIFGNGRDKTLDSYIQSISRLSASFTGIASYGASVTSWTISVKRRSDGGNPQLIQSHTGTTANPLSLSGIYDVIAEIRDSRGRSATTETSVTVLAYSPPSIPVFNTVRSTPTSTVNGAIDVRWSPMGTINPAAITIKNRSNTGTVVTLYNQPSSVTGKIDTTLAFSGQSDASSFEYTLTITDSFGNTATATSNVGTSFVELTIAKGKGVGIGKVHERGALDVNGDIYVNDQNLALLAYPVGSVYISVNSTNPAVLFGGTWVEFAKGRTLVGRDSSDTSFNTSEKIGGSKTHKLTESEMPRHSHGMRYNNSNTVGTASYPHLTGGYGPQGFDTGAGFSTVTLTGGGLPHSNLQPYITTYMWKRTS